MPCPSPSPYHVNKSPKEQTCSRARAKKDAALTSSNSKVHCKCGTIINDNKHMLQCSSCGLWSHIQCHGLSKRDADKTTFICHLCSKRGISASSQPPAPVAPDAVSSESIASSIKALKELIESQSRSFNSHLLALRKEFSDLSPDKLASLSNRIQVQESYLKRIDSLTLCLESVESPN